MEDFAQAPFCDIEFADNPEPRCACLLLLDTSGSMKGEAIEELNEGLSEFRAALLADPLAGKRVEAGVITFGDTVDVLAEFATVDDFHPQSLTAAGGTPMGEAIIRAADLIEDRKAKYRAAGVAYYRPWIFLITDGAPTDDWRKAAKTIAEGEARKQFMFYAVCVDGASMDVMSQISTRTPLRLKGLQFRELFAWLSSSLSSVSRSSPGEAPVLINPAAPDGWATAA
jgi:uncharacterized protein YegL